MNDRLKGQLFLFGVGAGCIIAASVRLGGLSGGLMAFGCLALVFVLFSIIDP